ncbi:MAG: extracellular solute-binding protein [Clostridia bacterium]|nr:extracellular solute-binding protein [Clostridia bacterium]
MKFKRIAALSGAAITAAGLAGCGAGTDKADGNGDRVKITCWTQLLSQVSQNYESFNDVPFYQALEEKCNVDLEFIHPAVGQETEKFNVMCASGEYPDMIRWDFTSYKGGPAKAVEDGVIIYLDDYMKYAPNYQKYLKDNPDNDKQVVTDEGKHYTFAFFRGDDSLMCWKGPQIRKDLLDKAGMGLPETIDDWDKALRKFKEMGIEYPLSFRGLDIVDTFSGAYGVAQGFYQEDGKIKYGPIEPGYKGYIDQLRVWYADGLLDNDFFAQDPKNFVAKVTSGNVGAYIGSAGGEMGAWLPVLQGVDASYDLSGTKYPVLNKGDVPRFGQKDFAFYPMMSTAVSSQCKNIEEVIKFLDYGYSEEGHMFWNFGTEGESYNMVDGYPKYTDEVLKNPEGLAIGVAMSKYCAASYGGSFVQDPRYYEQYLPYEQQKEAVNLWTQHEDDTRIPSLSFTAEENEELSRKTTSVNSYVNENILKFITGQRPMSEWESFVEQIKEGDINDLIGIRQAALDRYNNH